MRPLEPRFKRQVIVSCRVAGLPASKVPAGRSSSGGPLHALFCIAALGILLAFLAAEVYDNSRRAAATSGSSPPRLGTEDGPPVYPPVDWRVSVFRPAGERHRPALRYPSSGHYGPACFVLLLPVRLDSCAPAGPGLVGRGAFLFSHDCHHCKFLAFLGAALYDNVRQVVAGVVCPIRTAALDST
jgi:hypothetical protein